MHTSGYIHIGCDETRLLGHCRRCQEKVRSEGISRLYVDYVARMCRIVSSFGKRPMIWADIILKHPEALQSLPEDVIIVDWNYGWNQDHFGKMDNLQELRPGGLGRHCSCSHPDKYSIWNTMEKALGEHIQLHFIRIRLRIQRNHQHFVVDIRNLRLHLR